MLIEKLSILATQRESGLFADDMVSHNDELQECIEGKRILVVGGAGSIGSSTLQELARFHPKTLHVVDHNENSLTELVRHLRTSNERFDVPDFRSLPIDFGSPVMQRFIMEQQPYEYVFNFAALKHVRSEKDSCSLLHMLDTNIMKPARLLEWHNARGGTTGYFCVSTDKAANPVNLMGASKRIMEHVILSGDVAEQFQTKVTSARCPNVAFSDGSLLHGWLRRLEKRQPLAVPMKTRRVFISLKEAGQMCLLAALCAQDKHLLVPRLDPSHDSRDLESIACAVVQHLGFTPRNYDDEEEARQRIESDIERGCYPLLVTPLDTIGEKPYEEFAGYGEHVLEIGMKNLLAIHYEACASGTLLWFLDWLAPLLSDPENKIDKGQIIDAITHVVPEFHHRESSKHLDDRM